MTRPAYGLARITFTNRKTLKLLLHKSAKKGNGKKKFSCIQVAVAVVDGGRLRRKG